MAGDGPPPDEGRSSGAFAPDLPDASGNAPAGAALPPPPPGWDIRGRRLTLDRPVVVGILNVTPDSFSDGGRFLEADAAVERAWALAEEGADLLDVGAESTRPGAEPVPAEEEWSRLEPVLEGLAGADFPLPVSVDTTKAEVARRGLERGAAVLNDVSGLRFEPELAEAAAEAGAGLILMHMRGDPRTMQEDTRYDDLVGEVRAALRSSLEEAVRRGCDPSRVVLDPGIGFGKSSQGNLELLARIPELLRLGRPVLVGPSRKSFLGKLLDLPVEERVEGTVAACVIALERGARLFRVHDVRAVRRALDTAEAIRRAGPPRPTPVFPAPAAVGPGASEGSVPATTVGTAGGPGTAGSPGTTGGRGTEPAE